MSLLTALKNLQTAIRNNNGAYVESFFKVFRGEEKKIEKEEFRVIRLLASLNKSMGEVYKLFSAGKRPEASMTIGKMEGTLAVIKGYDIKILKEEVS